LNGGFGKAFNLMRSDLISEAKASENLALYEQKLLDEFNETHTETLARYTMSVNTEKSAWKLVGIDPEGFDLAKGDQIIRSHFHSTCDSIESAVEAMELMFRPS